MHGMAAKWEFSGRMMIPKAQKMPGIDKPKKEIIHEGKWMP